MRHDLNSRAARHILSRGLKHPARAVLARRHAGRHESRVLIYYSANRISWSQVYPFAAYGAALAEQYRTQIRFVPIERLLEHPDQVRRAADIILIQPWFTVDPAVLDQTLDRLTKAQPDARIDFLDSYAHNDLRLARRVDPYIRYYLKKSLFRDRSLYFRAFEGDTNLTEYYGQLYGLEQAAVDWQVPQSIVPKLRLSPNFLTAPHFIAPLMTEDMPQRAGRSLDITVRLGGLKGAGSYGAMRRHAQQVMSGLTDVTQSPAGALPHAAYMAEMRAARLCFSPFGYGELCWRDIEAMLSGTVTIKPDMSHLETLPDLYEPGVTYLPVRWDFADLEDVIRAALADEARCDAIARTAYDRMATYIREDRFVTDMGFVFR